MNILSLHLARTLILPLVVATVSVRAGEQATAQSVSPDEVLRRAAANEEKLKAAERKFSYRQDILVQTFGEAGSVQAQLRRISDVTHDSLGNRTERIIEYPSSPLTYALGVMVPDFKSLVGVEPFFLTPDKLPRYSIKFVERQTVDEIKTFVFEVTPAEKASDSKRKENEDRPFQGRIWVDDQDFQIVKAEGRAVINKEDRQRFPKFEYYREYVGEKYWLPSVVNADDVLEFKRYDVPIKMVIKFSDYKRVQPEK